MFRNRLTWTIRTKLVLLVVSAVCLAQVVAGGLAVWQELGRYASAKRETLLATAHVLAAAAATPTAAYDASGAYRTLRAIGRIDGLDFASISTPDGKGLADLGTSEQLASDARLDDDDSSISPLALLSTRTIELSVPIIDQGATVGSLRLVANTADLPERLRHAMLSTIIGLLVSLALGVAAVLRLQGAITRPLVELTRAMAGISARHDYSVALASASRDEVGILVGSFNTMIGEIQARDARLARHREELEIEVVDRTRDFRLAKIEAETANQQKSDFLAVMSHEIRTPMNGMLVMADLLVRGDLPGKSRRYAEVIARSGQSLLAIINDILDLSKVEAGKLDLESVSADPAELVGTVLDVFFERARSKGLDLAARIATDVPSRFSFDPVRLNQVLSNLVNNALKFTETGSVLISVMLDPIDGRRVRFSVIDTGIGIPSDKVGSIFQAFSQADQSTTRRFGGTGLGLTISRKLVIAMGADIAVTSEVGQGSTFSFSIAADDAIAPSPWVCHDSSAELRAVLAVKGDATRSAARYYLEQAGYQVHNVTPENIAHELTGVAIALVDAPVVPAERTGPCRLLAVSEIGDERGDALRSRGLADDVLTRPISRADMLAVLRGQNLAQQPGKATTSKPALQFVGRIALVADDSAVNREVAQEALVQLGFRVDLVDDGAAAVAACAQKSYDVVLMDGSMPVLDGYQAAEAIRTAERTNGTSHLPIVALTAHVIGEAATSWRSAGMDAHLAKPFTVAGLAACLASVLDGRSYASSELPTAPPTPEEPGEMIAADKIKEFGSLVDAGRGDFVQRVVGLYAEHAPVALAEIRRTVLQDDPAALAKAAHALKSMSLNIGAAQVAKMSAEIEVNAKLHDMCPRDSDVSRLNELLAAAVAQLRTLGPENTAGEHTRPFKAGHLRS